MSLQRNVAQQNDETRAEIERAAAFTTGADGPINWLPTLLLKQGQSIDDGILARLWSVPEQSGTSYEGLWLNRDREFWAFELTVSRQTGRVLELERFENVSHTIAVTAHLSGTGKSFGFLALEVMTRRLLPQP